MVKSFGDRYGEDQKQFGYGSHLVFQFCNWKIPFKTYSNVSMIDC